MKQTRIEILLTLALAFLAALALTATANAQDVAKNDAKPAKAESKPDPMALTPEESVLLRPIFDDFNKLTAKLNAAMVRLDKSEDAASSEIELLQIENAAKDIRAVRKEMRNVEAKYVAWEKEAKAKRQCDDCRFDQIVGKFIKVGK